MNAIIPNMENENISSETNYQKTLMVLFSLKEFEHLDQSQFSIELFPFRKSGPHSLLVFRTSFGKENEFVIKLPRYINSQIANEALSCEFASTIKIYSNKELSVALPEPICLKMIDNIPVYVSRFCHGNAFSNYIESLQTTEEFELLFEKCVNFLINLNKSTAVGTANTANDTFLDAYIDQPFKLLCHYFPNAANNLREYIEQIKTLLKNLNVNIPYCFEHKDFNPYNLKIGTNRELVVLDWEDGIENGLPLMDLFNLSILTIRLLTTSPLYKKDPTIINTFIESLKEYIRIYTEACKIPGEAVDSFFVIFCLRNTALLLDTKRQEIEYSHSWWYFLEHKYSKNIFIRSLLTEISH
ncbi:MAG TPA: hypothetical protein DCS13_02285 [Candidatus Margulisbacteria bacterium]|nr:hypothetical protein [Candidatus Margulisiibacteriota bacterium]